MSSRRALLRHVWSMLQTRAEAAGLVLTLQWSALGRGLAWYAIAAMAAMALMFSLLLLIALGTPEEYRALVLGVLTLALFAAAAFCAVHAKRELTRDTALIAEFTSDIRLDLAMVNLALKDPDTDDEEKLAAREHARTAVPEAAAEESATPGTAGATDTSADEPAIEAAMRAAASDASGIEMSRAPVTPPEEMTAPPREERPFHGSP